MDGGDRRAVRRAESTRWMREGLTPATRQPPASRLPGVCARRGPCSRNPTHALCVGARGDRRMRVPEVAGSTADAPSPGTLKFRLARRAEGEVPTVEWLGDR